MTVLEGKLVETPTGPHTPPPVPKPEVIVGELVAGEREYVTNPHTWELGAAFGLLLVAGAGTTWSVYRDYQHAGLSLAAMLLALAVIVASARRYNAWNTSATF